MNIDERLEALTQSIELLVSMHNDHERHFEEHRKEFAEQRKEFAEQRKEFAEHKRLVTGAIESIAETNRQLGETDRKLAILIAGMHDDQVRMRSEQQQDRGEFRDAMMRLSVIAEAHQDTLDDHEKRLGRPAA